MHFRILRRPSAIIMFTAAESYVELPRFFNAPRAKWYHLCLQGLHYNCDQPAWNHIVRQDWIAGRVNLLPYGNPYIIHAGPLEGSEREKFQAIVGKQNIPSFDISTRQMKSPAGSLFAAFHQYTRVSKIRNAVLSRNGCLFEFYRGKLLVAIRERLGIGPKWTLILAEVSKRRD